MLPGVKAEEAYPPLHLGIPAFSAWPQAAASGSAVPEKAFRLFAYPARLMPPL